MTGEDDFSVRAKSIPGFLAGLPAMLGYRPVNQATVTALDGDGQILATAVLEADAAPGAATAALRGIADKVSDARAVIATVHAEEYADPALLAQAGARLATAVASAGLPQPEPGVVLILGTLAWPFGRPEDALDLNDYASDPFASAMTLLNGDPAADLTAARTSLDPTPGLLRDTIAAALPRAIAQGLRDAEASPSRWRESATDTALARLSDPQPWTGADAAAVLLALADPEVRDRVIEHTARARHDRTGEPAPDGQRLAELVRQAPPGLIEGPATVLAVQRLASGFGPVPVSAACRAALADHPSAVLPKVIEGYAAAPADPLLAMLATPHRSVRPANPPTAFGASADGFPDPLARPLALGGADAMPDPLAAPPPDDPFNPAPPPGPAR